MTLYQWYLWWKWEVISFNIVDLRIKPVCLHFNLIRSSFENVYGQNCLLLKFLKHPFWVSGCFKPCEQKRRQNALVVLCFQRLPRIWGHLFSKSVIIWNFLGNIGELGISYLSAPNERIFITCVSTLQKFVLLVGFSVLPRDENEKSTPLAAFSSSK